MKNKMIYLILSATVTCTPCFSQEQLPEEPKQYLARPLTRDCAPATDEEEMSEEREMMSARAFSFPYELSDELMSTVVHTIKAVDLGGDEITLDDNCIIEVWYWCRSVAQKWEQGDQIVLTFYKWNIFYPKIEICNLTKQESVRAEYISKRPNISNHSIVVKEILPKGIVAINRDIFLQFGNDYLEELYHYWTEGDLLEIFLDHKFTDGSHARVWNASLSHSGCYMPLDVKVLTRKEALLILN